MDVTQFSAKVRTCEQKLYHVAKCLLNCEADCEDAVQEALIRAWRKIGTLRHEEYFDTWLIRILINECKSELRRRARRPDSEIPESFPAPEAPDAALREALLQLDIKYRLPLTLHYLYGYEVKAVSRILRLPEGTCKSRLHRARQLLRDILEKEDAT